VPDSFDGGFAGFDDQLAVASAGGEPEEVEPVVEVDDARLVLVEGQSSGCQPGGEPRFDLFGLLPGIAEGDHVVGVPDQRWGAAFRALRIAAFFTDSRRLFQPMQRDIQQQRTEDSSNAMGNFVFEVSLSYRRLERPSRVTDGG
jgi:hypothetical protein